MVANITSKRSKNKSSAIPYYSDKSGTKAIKLMVKSINNTADCISALRYKNVGHLKIIFKVHLSILLQKFDL